MRARTCQAGTDVQFNVAVFAVKKLVNKKLLYKVDINAQQFHLRGCAAVCPALQWQLVVVEGSAKAVKKYVGLMTARINWAEGDQGGGG